MQHAKLRKQILFFLVVLIILSGCFKGKEMKEEEVKEESEYSIIFEKILKDVETYEITEKREQKNTFIGEGMYINVLSEDGLSGYEGWYYYAMETLSKLDNIKTNELLTLLAICGPKSRVYCVFGDKAKGIFAYKSIEDTKESGEKLPFEVNTELKKVENTGNVKISAIETGSERKKAYIIDNPTSTIGGIIIKYARELEIESKVKFINETEEIESQGIVKVEDGIAKIEVELPKGDYIISSENIYFNKYDKITVEVSIEIEKIIKYRVIYDSNGGNENLPIDNNEYNYNDEVKVLYPFGKTGSLVKSGYTFYNWNTESDGKGINYSANETFKITKDTILYAKWEKLYTVKFESNGGSAVPEITNAIYYTTIKEPIAPTKTGYTFTGWYKDLELKTKWNFASDRLMGNMTLYAKWSINSYTVTFDKNGGDIESNPTSKTRNYNTNIDGLPTSPTRIGYTFIGWNTASDGSGTSFNATTAITGDITVYAQWDINSYTVTFNKNGGDVEANPTSKTRNYNTNIDVLPNAPTRTGYTFAGWNTASNGSGTTFDSNTPITGDVTVYAKWDINSYTVTFNKNGGDSEANPTSKTRNYNTNIDGLPTAPTRTGYTFAGWNTASDGSGTSFNATTAITGDITVYAQWDILVEIGIEMVLVPAGTTSPENGNKMLSQSFYIGKYEITQSQWKAVMTGNSNEISATPSHFVGNPNNPVEKVSWYDVLVYCNRLSIKEGKTPVYSIAGSKNPEDWGAVPTIKNDTWDNATIDASADGYRLPISLEWEYVARGGKDGNATTYAGSNTIEDVAWWYYSNSGATTHTVGTKQSNELGIYDMSGNVWEWCYDWSPEAINSSRIHRGGSFEDFAEDFFYVEHIASRSGPFYRSFSIGFRIARSF